MAGPKALLSRDERKELRREERKQKLEYMRQEMIFEAAKDVRLKKYRYLSDEELKSKHFLTPAQIARVREWEKPKKEVGYGVEGSQRLLEVLLRADGEKKTLQVNVENLSIQLPEKQPDAIEAVVIEAEAGE